MKVHAQRKGFDCGIAALASFVGADYEDVYACAVAVSPTFRQGLAMREMITIAEAFGHPLERVDYRKVDLLEDVGILGVNWHRSMWKIHGGVGHWVVLRRGTIIDPVGPTYDDAGVYLKERKGRPGTLLRMA